MDPYEAISESIDIIVIESRRQKLSPEEARKELFSAMAVMFGVLNKVEEIEPTLSN